MVWGSCDTPTTACRGFAYSSMSQSAHSALVTDFDGTLTQNDFYRLVVDRFLPDDAPDYWAQYRSGRLSHFDALAQIFLHLKTTEAELLDTADDMELEPELPGLLARLRKKGWHVIVTSAGCEWYIRHLLDGAGVDLEVHTNPGRFEPGVGLVMERPVTSPYQSADVGIDKAAVVRVALGQYRNVAFAGDGFPDLAPARLVPDELRFARADLADAAREAGLAYRPFERWRDVAESVLAL